MKILIISQLALGDALLVNRLIVSKLQKLGFDITVLCNQYNHKIFINQKVKILIEDWPTSIRRFEFKQFSSMFSKKIASFDLILIPSGNFIEKIISMLRISGKKIFSELPKGLLQKRASFFFGKYISPGDNIKLLSLDAYSMYQEYLAKVLQIHYSKNLPYTQLAHSLNLKGIRRIIIQTEHIANNKSICNSNLQHFREFFKTTGFEVIEIYEKNQHLSEFTKNAILPKDLKIESLKPKDMLIVLDSFLSHKLQFSSLPTDKLHVYVNNEISYNWIPNKFVVLTSFFSLLSYLND